MARFIDITGQRFGRLQALAFAGIHAREARWHCRCDCGTETLVTGWRLRSGATQSCGCLARELSSRRAKGRTCPSTRTHCKRGHEFTPENTHLRRSVRTGASYPRCRACKSEDSRGRVRRQARQRTKAFVPVPVPSLDGEIWKPIPDRPGYEVSSLGRVKSLDHMTAVKVDKSRWGVEYTAIVRHHGRIIKQQVVKGGYMRVSLGTSKCNLVARLVLRAFVGDPPPGDYEAAHSDGNPQNNTLANLAWKTPKENTADKRRHGTMWRPSLAITQCKHGHDLTDSTNVYIRKDNAGRMCRQCKRRRDRAYKLTQRVAA